MKAVLISIQPKWCELIALGKKTVEVRKTRPKIEPPFKVYVYCTLPPKEELFTHGCIREYARELIRLQDGRIVYDYGMRLCCDPEGRPYSQDNFLCQKVIGEFVCDRIDYWNHHIHDDDTISLERASEMSLVSEDDLVKYADIGHFYAWHISDLVIYEKLRPLSDFKPPCDGFDKRCQVSCAKITTDGKSRCTRKQFTRPPQSWCYVEEGGADNEQRKAD